MFIERESYPNRARTSPKKLFHDFDGAERLDLPVPNRRGLGANPDHRENYRVKKDGPREPAAGSGGNYYANPEDNPDGFLVNGTIPTSAAEGVHSLTDVPVYAMGPCQAEFGGTYSNIDVFYKIAECLGLGHGTNKTVSCSK